MKQKRPRKRCDSAPNNITGSARAVIAEVAEQLGGVERLIAWAKDSDENKSIFYTEIYPLLIDSREDEEPKKRSHFFISDRPLSPEEWEKILRAEGIER